MGIMGYMQAVKASNKPAPSAAKKMLQRLLLLRLLSKKLLPVLMLLALLRTISSLLPLAGDDEGVVEGAEVASWLLVDVLLVAADVDAWSLAGAAELKSTFCILVWGG